MRQFFERPAVWKPILLVLAYLAFYQCVGLLVGLAVDRELSTRTLLDSPGNIAVGLILPIGIGAAALVLLAASLGWLRPLFSRQPVRGSRWMWFAPVIIAVSIVLHLVSVDYGAYSASIVATMALAGVCIGTAEELITRGFAVKMLREAGRSEWVVMALSSLLFALMHTINLLSGQALTTTLVQLGFTFGFGICMYLAMRVTGYLIVPIVLHGFYDPTLFLATGGINHVSRGGQGAAAELAGLTIPVFLIFAFVAFFLVRGRAAPATNPVLD